MRSVRAPVTGGGSKVWEGVKWKPGALPHGEFFPRPNQEIKRAGGRYESLGDRSGNRACRFAASNVKKKARGNGWRRAAR